MKGVADPLDFTGKTVLVVGGSSGIGRGTARAFVSRGATVHVWGTRPDLSDYEDAQELAGIHYAQVDVVDAQRVAAAASGFTELDVLILCQGTVLYNRREFETEAFRRVIDVNLTSMMTCAQTFHDALRASKGSIVIVSSTAAYRATRGNPAYAASKAGLLGLTRTLGQAWARKGIRVNGIAPGFVDTKLTKVTTEDPERLAEALGIIPLGRLGEPADMAGVVLFLASPLANYVVGETILVDGGLTL
ncbi:SDR family NAD(P)-dependent oxidoreductase [Flavisphingomonas formosensis]|uniref:SDR family NAD(P)-dependent oxidoreductase n=1 Tax=Flavisphingomonas formosensis TaxID=861534 RepID=UPI0012F7CD00|nr:SDR family NAD(P)-dependent oxidoreductase [Sphingomonas formosensis]